MKIAHRIFLGISLVAVAGCSTATPDGEPKYSHQPALGLSTPGDSVALTRTAVQRLRSAAVVIESSSAVIEAMAANPLDYACDAGDAEAKLCDEFLAEPPANYAAAVLILVETAGGFAADTAVGLGFLAQPTKIANFLYLPPGGLSNGMMVGYEPRPLALEGPLAWRLVATDTQVAASPVGLLSARVAEQIFLARATQGVPSAPIARAMSLLLARYAMLMASP